MAGPHALLQMDSGELRGTPRLLNGIGRFIPGAELRVAGGLYSICSKIIGEFPLNMYVSDLKSVSE